MFPFESRLPGNDKKDFHQTIPSGGGCNPISPPKFGV